MLLCHYYQISTGYDEKSSVGTRLLFQASTSQFSISLKCMVRNYFAAFSVCCCVTIIEFVHYNEKHGHGYPVVSEFFSSDSIDMVLVH